MKIEGTDTISGALTHDHRRLEDLRERAERALRAADNGEGSGMFAEFDQGLRDHIRVEEELLFRVLEQKAGLRRDFGPIAVMVAEHRAIEGLLDELARTFSGEADARNMGAVPMDQLRATLETHDAKEEMVLYPMADRMLGEAERDSIVARLRAH